MVSIFVLEKKKEEERKMRIEFKENNGRELVSVEDGRVALKNFRGDKFGNGGKRSFCLVIPTEEIKDELIKRGWNVRIKPPFHEDEEPFMYLPININDFRDDGRGPNVYIKSGNNPLYKVESNNRLDSLQDMSIAGIDLYFRPYDNPERGTRTAWAQSLKIYQRITDPFYEDYEHENNPANMDGDAF